MLIDELNTINKNLEVLQNKKLASIDEINKFEEILRKQILQRHSHITPPHLDISQKVPIDDIYVSPSFIKKSKRKDEKEEDISMSQMLLTGYRVVILGNPGGGKSTFVLKVCYDLSEKYTSRLFNGRKLTPILVILRDYGSDKKNSKCSILQFIESLINSKYQVRPPVGALEYLLLNNRLLIIFDGLDELLETSYRKEISADVESFCSLYPSVPVLVTSREVGYEQAPLSSEMFDTYNLASFNNEKVNEYVKKWFAVDRDIDTHEQGVRAERFLMESRVVPDLTSNPLMLALMCNIYRGENYIPKNRPDVYEKCALLLFERWDKSRGINYYLPIEAHIRPTMMFLAHWIYSDVKLQGGVTKQQLVTQASSYLYPKRFEDLDEAEMAAREFVDFCKGRAWVFSDMGSTKEGESIYQFTHRTFLEYFTAAYLVRTNNSPIKLGDHLFKKITKQEWDVAAQLSLQILNKQVEGAGDEFLNLLLTRANKRNPSVRKNVISFLARSLEFIIPSPIVTRNIVTLVLDLCFVESLEKKGRLKEKSSIGLLGFLISITNENEAFIFDQVKKLLINEIRSSEDQRLYIALDIALHLDFAFHDSIIRNPSKNYIKVLDLSDDIYYECFDIIKVLADKSYSICLALFERGDLLINQIIDSYGWETTFSKAAHLAFTNTYSGSPVERIIGALFFAPFSENMYKRAQKFFDKISKNLASIESYELLSNIKKNMKNTSRSSTILVRLERNYDKLRKDLNLGSTALFNGFLLIAASFENGNRRGEAIDHEFFDAPIFYKNYLLMKFRSLFETRFLGINNDEAFQSLELLEFSSSQKEIIKRWALREVNFVENEDNN